MSERYPGGIITKNAIVPSGPYGTNEAPGIWTLDQALQAQRAGNWPVVGGPYDLYFDYVTLLLHGDGTNGGQNNTFVDGSTNNFTITRNGNTTQGSFSPYGELWSNYFDGTGDSVQTVSSTLWTWATATSWTVEAFVYPVTRASVQPIYGAFAGVVGSATNNGELLIETTGQVTFRYWNGAEQKVTTTGTVPLNTWSHVVMAYDGTDIAIYINGTRSANTAKNGTPDSTTNILYFGTTMFGTTANTQIYFTGYISNARVVRNSVVYSGATISVPTAPLTAITNTSLLTCQSNRFRDNSSNNFTITRNGDVSVQRFSPFAPSAAYSTASLGGSGYFDGTGDYLSAPSNAALAPGSSAFTWECWFYPTAAWEQTSTNGDTLFITEVTSGLQIGRPGTGTGNAWGLCSNGVAWRLTSTTLPTLGQWNHMAVVRSGTGTNQTALFLNGARVAQGTVTDTFAQGVSYIMDGTSVGATESTGYISDMRLLKGTALYDPASATYTVPTAPLTAITNTSLLLNFTNASIFDNAMMADLETVGNAQISTSVKKYGTGSLAFDGSGDYLFAPYSVNTDIGGAPFTFECWLYTNNISFATYQSVLSKRIQTGTTNAGFTFGIRSNGNVIAWNGTTEVATSGITLQSSTWYHVAWVYSGSVLKIFVNGTEYYSAAYSIAANSYPVQVGCASNNGAAIDFFNGYIDDLRITKGVARYTNNFIPPVQAFPNL